MPPGDVAMGKVRLSQPAIEVDGRDFRKHEKTLRGLGGDECPNRDGCQLEFLKALERRDDMLRDELRGIRDEVEGLRRTLAAAMSASRIRNQDSTPVRSGMVDVSAGPVKFRGARWVIVGLVALLGSIAAVAYVLGEWGPQSCAKTEVAKAPK